jgi:hypothetical protein
MMSSDNLSSNSSARRFRSGSSKWNVPDELALRCIKQVFNCGNHVSSLSKRSRLLLERVIQLWPLLFMLGYRCLTLSLLGHVAVIHLRPTGVVPTPEIQNKLATMSTVSTFIAFPDILPAESCLIAAG